MVFCKPNVQIYVVCWKNIFCHANIFFYFCRILYSRPLPSIITDIFIIFIVNMSEKKKDKKPLQNEIAQLYFYSR